MTPTQQPLRSGVLGIDFSSFQVENGYGDGYVSNLESGYDFDAGADYNMVIHPTIDAVEPAMGGARGGNSKFTITLESSPFAF